MANALDGLERPPGDPVGWQANATAWADLARELGEAAGTIQTAAGQVGAGWVGTAATAFGTATTELGQATSQTQTRYEQASTAMASYAGQLEDAQNRYDSVVGAAEQLAATPPQPLEKDMFSTDENTGPGGVEWDRIRGVAQGAIDDAQNAGRQVVAALDGLTGQIAPVPPPPKTGFWASSTGRFLAGVGAPVGSLLKTDWDTEGEWFLDPSRALSNDEKFLEGLGHTVTHPGDFVSALFDTKDLKDGNDAGWAGQMTTNIIAAVFTDGLGDAGAGGAKALDAAGEDLNPAEKAAVEAAAKAARAKLPQFLQNIAAGRAFERYLQAASVAQDGGVAELRTAAGKRVDIYLAGKQIVSIKYTQLASVSDSTAIGYVKELGAKYAPDTEIDGTPSVPDALKGQKLAGRQVLLVPVQTAPIPASVLAAAKAAKVTIEDVDGHTYR